MLTIDAALDRSARPPAGAEDPYAPWLRADAALRTVGFECSPPQHDFLTDDRTRILAFIGGVGSGKTWALARYVVLKMRRERGTGTVGGIFANTYQQLSQVTLPAVWAYFEELGLEYGRDYVFDQAPPKTWAGFTSRFRRHANVLSVRPWGQAICRSLENYDNLRGVELGWAAQDEIGYARKEAFTTVMGRLRCPRCSHIEYRGVSTPKGFNWVYDEFVEAVAKGKTDRRMVHARTTDNFALDESYVEMLLGVYDPALAQQEIDGLFVSLTKGRVYRNFDRAVHVDPGIRPDPKLNWQVCFDFNRTPFSVVLCQTVWTPDRDPEKAEVRVVDEVFADDCDTESACREIINHRLRRADRAGNVTERFDADGLIEVYGDPAGSHKDTRNNRSDWDIVTREFSAAYGPRFVRCWRLAHPPVMGRVNAVNAMLRNAKGRVRLRISPRCINLQRDFERVMFRPGTNDIHKSGEENARLTHLSDALGYYIVERFPLRVGGSGRVTI